MGSEGKRWTIAVDFDWPDSAVVVDEDSPRRMGFVYYEVEPVGESASEIERLREAVERELPTIRTAVLNGEYATSGSQALDRLRAALHPDEKEGEQNAR